MTNTLPANWPPGVPVFEEIRVENTNHCSYECFFCPRDKLTRDRGFMSLGDLEKVLAQFPDFSGQVDLHGFGEPLLDKDLVQKIGLVKRTWPKCRTRIYSTLGVRLQGHQRSALVTSGLNTIEVSFYGIDRESYRLTHGVDRFDIAFANLTALCTLNKTAGSPLQVIIRDFPLHDDVKRPGMENKKLDDFRAYLSQIGVSEIHDRQLHNYGGGRSYNAAPADGVCSIAWGYRKRVLQVAWNLDIIPCCFDFNATVVIGSLRHHSISEIYQLETYKNFIDAHQTNDLSKYAVCVGCERCFKE
jgi:MoaA/NifB/PqqE/SkfB family radical SAM enzyme